MDLVTAISTRRSERHLTDPAPDAREFGDLLAIAAHAPDHGVLQPWRWILVRGDERLALGESFAEGLDGEQAAKTAAKALRAPLLATLVFAPRVGHRIPEWQQLAATGGMSHAMMLLLHARGYGSIWRTGALTESPTVHRTLGLTTAERLLGWLYVGTPVRGRVLPPRIPADLTGKLSSLRADAVAQLT
jgi:nitroreductase